MSEVTFAKAFLANLDRKPVKLSSDYIADPKKYPSQSPLILSKPANPYPSSDVQSTSKDSKNTITITLRATKGSTDPVTLPGQQPGTTILELKEHYAKQTGNETSKIKLLYNKRPASDLKTLKELLPQPTPSEVEFTVMVLGGVTAGSGSGTPQVKSPEIQVPDPVSLPTQMDIDGPAPLSEKANVLSQTTSNNPETAAGILKTDEFWSDLKGFLAQRLKDENEGQRLVQVFRSAAGH